MTKVPGTDDQGSGDYRGSSWVGDRLDLDMDPGAGSRARGPGPGRWFVHRPAVPWPGEASGYRTFPRLSGWQRRRSPKPTEANGNAGGCDRSMAPGEPLSCPPSRARRRKKAPTATAAGVHPTPPNQARLLWSRRRPGCASRGACRMCAGAAPPRVRPATCVLVAGVQVCTAPGVIAGGAPGVHGWAGRLARWRWPWTSSTSRRGTW